MSWTGVVSNHLVSPLDFKQFGAYFPFVNIFSCELESLSFQPFLTPGFVGDETREKGDPQ